MGARRRLAAIVASVLLLGACAGDDDPQVQPPVGGDADQANDPDGPGDEEPDPEGDDDGENDDPYAVPDEIDEAYAEDVINALLAIEGEAVEIALGQEQGEHLAPEAIERFHAVAAGQRLDFLMETYQLYVDEPDLVDEFYLPLEEMGTTNFEAHGILHAEPDHCMLVVGFWDLSETAVDPSDEESLVSLSPVDRDVVEPDQNPTPWQMRGLTAMSANGEPVPEDRWDDLNLGDLDRTCENR